MDENAHIHFAERKYRLQICSVEPDMASGLRISFTVPHLHFHFEANVKEYNVDKICRLGPTCIATAAFFVGVAVVLGLLSSFWMTIILSEAFSGVPRLCFVF